MFEQLLATTPTQSVEIAHNHVGPDTIAKFLFTSGSTGTPKAVVNTQRMWCSNQAMILSQFAFFADEEVASAPQYAHRNILLLAAAHQRR